jgi:hypothetical protein
MEEQVINPLVIRCKNCGGDLSFDIVKQKYCCAHCGSEANASEKKAEYKQWKSMHNEVVMQDLAKVKTFACPKCGARTMAAEEDASTQCPFCQNTMIDAEFAGNDLPEVIIPFKISKEEAMNKLNTWLGENKNNAAAKLIEKNLHRFTGCYLPYHIVRGGYNGNIAIGLQDGTAAHYPFRAYLSHTAVNASQDWDNLFLDGIEPFDFSETREFDFRFLNHQNAKIQNVVGEALSARVEEETRAELYQSLAKKVRTKEMTVILDDNENESIPALMPVYLVKCENGVAAAVNGQIGKVSIATGKTINLTKRWWLWPTLATLAVGIISALLMGETLAGAAVALVFGLVFFAVAHNRHHKEIINEIITVPKGENRHNDTRTEFFADFGKGLVPAELKFFTPARIIKLIVGLLVVTFLPLLIAIPIQILRGLPLSDIHIGYGAAWYITPAFMAIVLAGGAAKTMMYGEPLYYEKLPNGTLKRRKLPSQQKFSLKQIIPALKKGKSKKGKAGLSPGCAIVILLLLLFGSVAAMLS